jgi:hypothetical protein
MNNERYQFMSVASNLMGRLTVEETALILQFHQNDIPILVKEGLLKPLGKPAANAVKYFAATVILALARDAAWLAKATRVIYDYWLRKKSRRTNSRRVRPNDGAGGNSGSNPLAA